MRDEFKQYFEEEPSEAHNRQVNKGALPLLAEKKRPFFSFVFSTPGLMAFGSALAIAVAFVVLEKRAPTNKVQPAAFLAYDQAMLKDVDLLLKLQVLQNMDLIEKAEKKKLWPKKKST